MHGRAAVILLLAACASAPPPQTKGVRSDGCLDDVAAELSAAGNAAESGDPESSVRHYRCVLGTDPSREDVRIELGAQLIEVKAFGEAEAELAKIRAPSFRVRTLRAVALEALGRVRDAADQVALAAEETASSAVLYRRAAELFARAGDETRADELRAKADAIDPPPAPRELRQLPPAKPPPSEKKKGKKKKS